MKENKTREFYKVLFNDDEFTCFGENKYATKTYSAIKTGIKEENVLFSINPHLKGSTRADTNVIAWRNLLFEIDEYNSDVPGVKGDPVPLDIQATIVHRAGLPYSTCVNSGGKSLHWIVAVDDPFVSSKVEIESLWKAIADILNKTAKEMGHNITFDRATKNPSRLSRAAGAVRIKENGENKIQKVQRVRGRISSSDLLNWLESNEVDWYSYMPKPVDHTGVNQYNFEASDEEKIHYVLNNLMKNQVYENGKKVWQFKFARMLKNTGFTPDQCRAAIIRECGVIDSRLDIDGIFRRYSDDEKIYVWSKAEKMAWAKEQERLEMARNGVIIEPGMTTPTVTLPDGEEIEVPYDNNLNNYALIGPDVYLVYPDGEREKFNTTGFKARFPSKDVTLATIPNRYSGFGYYPDYFNNRKKLSHNRYNTFQKPNVEPQKGEWPMTEILLRHMFGEKYELALELCWVWRNHPERATPGLAFPGVEDAGKTTFADWVGMVYGNVNTIAMSSLAKDENAYVKNCQFIVLEESSSKAMKNITPQEVVDKLKPLVTQTGKKVPCKELYSNGTETDYWGHVIILSNDMAPIKMQGESTRWWVSFVNKPEKHDNFVERLQEEVGAFLYFLDWEFEPSRRESKERLWFHPDEYWTIDKERALTQSGSKLYKIIKSILVDFFEENPEEELCYFDLKSLHDIIKQDINTYSKFDVKDCLIEEFRWKPSNGRKTVTDSLTNPDPGQTLRNARKMQYYVVTKDIIPHEEIEYGVSNLGL